MNVRFEKHGNKIVIGNVEGKTKPVIHLKTPFMKETYVGAFVCNEYAEAFARLLADIIREDSAEWKMANGYYSCSNCKEVYEKTYSYCPTCGHRMSV